jgi:subtilisin-like proprotein convertase family protein/Mg-chelatase subunit ChlD
MQRTLLAGVVAALWATPARADTLITSLQQPMFEASHTVDIKVSEGVATYTVRRTFMNMGTRSDQAIVEIDLPFGAAATGLRIKARDRWYDGELMEREKAAALYEKMTGVGRFAPKDPALLSWAWADKLHLQVFPVFAGQVSSVEYTLTVPTRYANGRYWLSYPRVQAGAPDASLLATPVVTVHPAWKGTEVMIDGAKVAAGTAQMLLAPVHPPWFEVVAEQTEAASYVASVISVPVSSHTTKPISAATVTLDIAHTYRGDLRVDLITPQGKAIAVREPSGEGENDLKGQVKVVLPAGTTGAGTWRLVVSDHAALDTGSLDGWQLAFGAGTDATTAVATDVPLFVPDAPESESDAGVATICVGSPAIATWTARLGRVFASYEHAFARLELDVAPRVSELPKKAQIVFVLDKSRSVGEDGLAAQLAIIRAYLAHVPDAEVEIVAYDRRASRVFGELVPAPQAFERLAKRTFALGNGSALDAAARVAASVLADRKGPRRVVLLTDELVRSALTQDAALASLAALSSDTIVHVVVPVVDHDDRAHLDRDDAGELGLLATRHHGIGAKVAGFPVTGDKVLAPLVLELVRPTRIEQLAVKGFELETTTLREGEGLRVVRLAQTAPTRIVITGKMWSDPVRREVLATEAFSRASAAFVFGEDRHQELTPAEQMRIAMYGKAVSPVTSYVAAEPGTRPSTEGLDDSVLGGLLGNEVGEANGGFGFGRSGFQPDLASMIDTEACLRAHPQRGPWRVELTVETTRDEVVDVITDDRTPLAACLVEAAWALQLPASFAGDHATFSASLTR